MISIKNQAQIEKMRAAGHLLHDILQKLRQVIRPGESTAAIDAFAEELIKRAGATPSFLGYKGYPASICASVDEQVVHGIPNEEPLKEGSILSIDCGLILDGWHADSAFTAAVGTISAQKEMLIKVTQQSFFQGVRQALAGNRVGDIGAAVQRHVEAHGYGIIRDLCGHGIGRSMHEDPSVPNFVENGHMGARLRPGMTLAVEPMVSMGSWQVRTLEDDWTIVTLDGSSCAHYEHTILIKPEGLPEILTLPGFSWEDV